jgi:hypothetical protein
MVTVIMACRLCLLPFAPKPKGQLATLYLNQAFAVDCFIANPHEAELQ